MKLEDEHPANIIMVDGNEEEKIEEPAARWTDDHPKEKSKKSDWVHDKNAKKNMNNEKSAKSNNKIEGVKKERPVKNEPKKSNGSNPWTDDAPEKSKGEPASKPGQKPTVAKIVKKPAKAKDKNGKKKGVREPADIQVKKIDLAKDTTKQVKAEKKEAISKKEPKPKKDKNEKNTKKIVKAAKKGKVESTPQDQKEDEKPTSEPIVIEADKDATTTPEQTTPAFIIDTDNTSIVEETPQSTEERIEKMMNDIEPLLHSDIGKAKEIYKKINIHYQYLDEDNKLKYYDKIHHLYKKITQGS